MNSLRAESEHFELQVKAKPTLKGYQQMTNYQHQHQHQLQHQIQLQQDQHCEHLNTQTTQDHDQLEDLHQLKNFHDGIQEASQHQVGFVQMQLQMESQLQPQNGFVDSASQQSSKSIQPFVAYNKTNNQPISTPLNIINNNNQIPNRWQFVADVGGNQHQHQLEYQYRDHEAASGTQRHPSREYQDHHHHLHHRDHTSTGFFPSSQQQHNVSGHHEPPSLECLDDAISSQIINHQQQQQQVIELNSNSYEMPDLGADIASSWFEHKSPNPKSSSQMAVDHRHQPTDLNNNNNYDPDCSNFGPNSNPNELKNHTFSYTNFNQDFDTSNSNSNYPRESSTNHSPTHLVYSHQQSSLSSTSTLTSSSSASASYHKHQLYSSHHYSGCQSTGSNQEEPNASSIKQSVNSNDFHQMLGNQQSPISIRLSSCQSSSIASNSDNLLKTVNNNNNLPDDNNNYSNYYFSTDKMIQDNNNNKQGPQYSFNDNNNNNSIISYNNDTTFTSTSLDGSLASSQKSAQSQLVKTRRGRPRKKGLRCKNKANGKLWEFIRDLLLNESTNPAFIRWERREDGVFKFVQSDKVAKMWGERKQNPKMTYEKLSRAMRYYYKSKVLLPVFGRRLVYKFGPNATGWLPTDIEQHGEDDGDEEDDDDDQYDSDNHRSVHGIIKLESGGF